ncbi:MULTISPECIES: hypothetical protein [Clostridium]|uniref:hypothetical protein n=1 Tax=Clostridium TaxID=1485 RepID=UPI0015E18572|nr:MULTISPECIES: hypothetical protein [Clostridium]MBN7575988.1 hypothetical protein [Clostridium beijerinckii]MBN7581179.1 hypothetical protein [Clostridium beijerinckii]MBN7585709.1 hypothetical protein [Clostridium beijerinckii]MBO0521498.1 hypothetical protein [Clostridium beijerinckii]
MNKVETWTSKDRVPGHRKMVSSYDKERSEKELQKLPKEKSYKDTDQSNPL